MNIVIESSPYTGLDLDSMFVDNQGTREEIHFLSAIDISNLMVQIGAYPSTSKARQAGRVGPVPFGFTEIKASKKMRIWVLNPKTS